MAKNPDAPDLTFSEGLDLPDGRRVRIQAYSDGSLRFRVSDPPYVIVEAFLQKASNEQAIIKLSPGGQGSANSVSWYKERMVVSPYKAAEIVNAYLKEQGIKNEGGEDKQVRPQMIYGYVNEGRIPASKNAQDKWEIKRSDLEEWLASYVNNLRSR